MVSGRENGSSEYNPEDTGPVGGRRRELPAVPPTRPRATPPQPTYHPTTELDLGRGFPPVSNETSEIDLSGGWPEHLKVPPRRPSAQPAAGRVLGVDVGTVRVGLALSDLTDASNYAQELADRIPDVPVILIDERLSTVTAASHLREGGIDSRKQRPVIDQAAAVVILQQFLDSRRPRT